MKIALTILFSFLLFSSSCNQNELSIKPEWLSSKVDEVITSDDLCSITTLTIYQFEGEYYYNIYCEVWSCMFFHLYDAEGNAVNWDSETFTLFHDESVQIEEFPACE